MDQQNIIVTDNEFCVNEKPGPCSIIIYGASGDLTARKIIPSIFGLYRQRPLSPNFYVMGCARTKMDDHAFRILMKTALTNHSDDESAINEFLKCCYYHAGDYDDIEQYTQLKKKLDALDEKYQTGKNRIFYMAAPSFVYLNILDKLSSGQLTNECYFCNNFTRIIVEKPIGHDLKSAREINEKMRSILPESQIYRIDHYLGKETVQNIMIFRFANTIFEPIWNRQYIDNVQISVAESLGVEHRAGYFEKAGLLRDMFQNHMLQMVALVASEPPSKFDAFHIRNEKVKILTSIQVDPIGENKDTIIRGQYDAGTINGANVVAYKDEEGVSSDSCIETYVALKLRINNWRWKGVPFYLRAGKRLNKKLTQIVIQFKQLPCSIFPLPVEAFKSNVLVINVQPDETIWLTQAKMAELFDVKIPAISKHLKNIFESGELDEKVVVSILENTTQHGAILGKTQTKQVKYYNLDAIIAAGYRVNSKRATQFRIWATNILKEYIIKGFAMNDDRLKKVDRWDYFDEWLERIRDIRASEKRFYQKVRYLFALSSDYDPTDKATLQSA